MAIREYECGRERNSNSVLEIKSQYVGLILTTSQSATQFNNRVAADSIKILVVMQRLLATAEHERYVI